jgi:hypothetical protein
MRGFLMGILLGICFDNTVTAIAKDYLNRSPQQQKYDFFVNARSNWILSTFANSWTNSNSTENLAKSPLEIRRSPCNSSYWAPCLEA